MQPRHIALALLVALIWGVNFVVIAVGLGSFPPLLLAALRFLVAAIPALFLPRPALSLSFMIAIAATLFVGHYGFLFPAMAIGMPPGLASITLQVQAFFTIAIAAVVLRERPRPRQVAGAGVALAGLAAIALTAGDGGMTAAGLALTLLGALSWASGNILLRRAGTHDMLALISWLSLIPPLPLFALSLAIEGPAAIGVAIADVDAVGLGALAYIAFLSTTVAFGIWGYLFRLYPASTVAPFSLLVPVFGTLAAALLVGETFSPLRLVGGALILAGLALIALPARLPSWRAS